MSAWRMALATLGRTWLLVGVCLSLVVATAGFAWRTVELGAQVATMTAAAAAKAVQHRREVARKSAQHRKEMAKMKARARLRRAVVALPLIGIAAGGYFEQRDYIEWRQENPDGDFDAYMTEMLEVSAEVLDDVLQELPEPYRPEPETVVGFVEDGLAAARDDKSAT